MKSRSYVGPVTSLAFLGDDLFAGHGSDLKLFSPSGSRFTLKWRKRVFKRERIQGIQFQAPSLDCESPSGIKVLLWGGKRFQIVQLGGLDEEIIKISPEDEIPAPDWIIHSTFLESKDGITKIALMTAHNTILTYKHDLTIPMAERFKFYPSPERCLLYSANIVRDNTQSNSNSLIAFAGTVFGEVLFWKVDASDEVPVQEIGLSGRYLSHEGSVFGVSISPDLKYAASCSDDRTIRLWETNYLSTNGQLNDCLEVKEPLAIGWGHQARIWGTRFLKSDKDEIKILSFSEDLTAKTWIFNKSSPKKSLVCTQTFKSLHSASGKNIWSLAVHPSETAFVTGGADSGIASWNLGKALNVSSQSGSVEDGPTTTIQETIVNLDEILPPTSSVPGKKPVKDEPRKYVALGSHAFIVAMSSGWLLHCALSSTGSKKWQKLGFWPQIKNTSALGMGKYEENGQIKYTVLLGDNTGKLLFLEANSEGLISTEVEEVETTWVQICESRPSDILFSNSQKDYNSLYAAVATFKPNEQIMLLQIQGATARKTLSLSPPETFPFTKILVHQRGHKRILIAGSRHGALAIYDISNGDETQAIQPAQVWRHIHDDESITSLEYKSSSSLRNDEDAQFKINFISTGRSGAYKFHTLSVNDTTAEYELSETNAVYPAAVPRVESYQILQHEASNNSYEIVYGFWGRDFVLWNQTLKIEAASYDCEGGNRSWDFSFGPTDTARNDGLFVFTKAKKCHIVQFSNILHDPLLQTPFHGRELKALAVSPATLFPYQIIATGAEDTVIRFSYVNPQTSELNLLTARKTHTTGIQDLVWSSCGGWLFSSGSIEEVYCWRVNIEGPADIPNGASIGVVKEAAYDISTDSLPDLRVCGLDVMTVDGENGRHVGFLLGMVRSDSSIKLAFYDITSKKFITVAEGFYKTSCLLQICFHVTDHGSVLMFTAGTDGHVTIWDITGILIESNMTVGSKHIRLDRGLKGSSPAKLQQEQWISCQSFHQNSIKCLEVFDKGEDEVVMLSGGDDTAISVACIKFKRGEASGKGEIERSASKLIERAHASAVTTIKVVSSVDQPHLEFVSSGVDQQIKKWSLKIAEYFTEVTTEVVEDVYVNIPDVAAICLVESTVGSKLVVGGVGVEVLDL
ncbi:hypothetical protein H072_3843 [Dactylellina haptotyla CBS 200.50]|uniref:Uncharacterized protein n=1 Tax=Dactylellina haptotyla (strain CBS 200.50) TaxID=1284197 RepID=S8C333_DACHA|nr:hypothetical protein H072_3843 [Dactylellina haptotyla CBS 200.50]